ncbi:MAG: hypothetical protein HQK51_06850 [Oligoflexia bacterium]|nr:hypothetical protein [Oligoflexia bacterium]
MLNKKIKLRTRVVFFLLVFFFSFSQLVFAMTAEVVPEGDSDIYKNYFQEFGTKKFAELSPKIPMQEIAKISTYTQKERNTLCQKIEEEKENFFEVLKGLSPRSVFALHYIRKGLAIYAEACLPDPSKVYFFYNKIHDLKVEFWQNLVQFPIFSTLPLSLFDAKIQNDNKLLKKINPYAFYRWIEHGLEQELSELSCRNLNILGLPEGKCFNSWLAKKLLDDQESFINDNNNFYNLIAQEFDFKFKQDGIFAGISSFPQVFPLFLSHVFEKSSYPANNFLLKLSEIPIEKRFSFLAFNANLFSPVLKNILADDFASSTSCSSLLQGVAPLLLKMKVNNVDIEFLPTLGRYLDLYCQNSSNLKKMMSELQKKSDPNLMLTWPYSDVNTNEDSLINLMFDYDISAKNILGLNLNLGSEIDITTLVETPSANYYEVLQDHIIADFLRSIDRSPWVRQDESVENVSVREQINATLLAKIVRSSLNPLPQEGVRLLQMGFLDHFDRETSESLISDLRNISFQWEVKVPSFQPIRLSIHNNLEKGVLKNLATFFENLSVSEKEISHSYYETLVKKLEQYFKMAEDLDLSKYLTNTTNTTNIEVVDTSVSEIVAKLKMEINPQMQFNLLITLASSVDTLIKNQEQKLQETQGLLSDSPDDKWYQKNKTIIFPYLNSLRLFKAIHQRLMATMFKADFKSSLIANHQMINQLMNHFVLYTGISPKEQNDLFSFNKSLTETIYRLFDRRLSLFSWLIFSQSRRITANQDYTLSISKRAFTLSMFMENFIREHGLYLLGQLDSFFTTSAGDNHYRAMNVGEAIGKLVFVAADKIPGHAYNRDEILITNTLPTNLGVTAGLITEVFQPLSSHVDLRTRERGTPNVYKENASKEFSALLGKWVKMTVSSSNISLQELSEAELKEFQTQRQIINKKQKVQVADIELREIIDLDHHLSKTTIEKVGAKAFGYSHLRHLFGVGSYTPKAVALPFGFYQWFVNYSGLNLEINRIIDNQNEWTQEKIQLELQGLQQLFINEAKKIDLANSPLKDLIPRLEALVVEMRNEGHDDDWDAKQICFKFRSSTNAEDLLGFTGAGLYSSKKGCLKPKKESNGVGVALGTVWGSLWNYRAFMERNYYGIDHRQVKMAILIHRNFENEEREGVILSESSLDPTYLISIVPKGKSITNSEGGREGDELSVVLNGDYLRVDGSYLDPTNPLLSMQQMKELVLAAKRVKIYFSNVFRTIPSLPILRMDMEFKFEGDKLYIKQARPYLSDY